MKITKSLFIAALAALMCVSAWANVNEVDRVELKLIVRPDSFQNSRAKGYDAVWRALAEEAFKLGYRTAAETKYDEDCLVIRSYDCVGKPFASNDYKLSQVFDRRRGKLGKTGTLFLTTQNEEGIDDSTVASFKAGGRQNVSCVYAAEIVGLCDSKPGRTRTLYAARAKADNYPEIENSTVAGLANDFSMVPQNIDGASAIRQLGGETTVYEAEIGKVEFGGGNEAEIEITTFYNRAGGKLLHVELSWSYENAVADAQKHSELFDALQGRTDIFTTGRFLSKY